MMLGSWTFAWNAGVPPVTQSATVVCSASLSRPTCGAVARADRMGALSLGGSVAGTFEGTHAIAPRKDVALHPAAGFVSPWHSTQWAWRMGATSTS